MGVSQWVGDIQVDDVAFDDRLLCAANLHGCPGSEGGVDDSVDKTNYVPANNGFAVAIGGWILIALHEPDADSRPIFTAWRSLQLDDVVLHNELIDTPDPLEGSIRGVAPAEAVR